MEQQIQPVGHCRVCGGTDLTFLFSLGNHWVNDFPEPGKERAGARVPLELELCRNPACQLVQLRHTAPSDFLYTRQYWYRSGVTQTMRDALADITRTVEQLVDLKPGDTVLDIGSNDGTLLRSYTANGIIRAGVEPALNLAKQGAEGVDVFLNDFWKSGSFAKAYQRWAKANGKSQDFQVKAVTAIGMFYDMDDPVTFVKDVAKVLARDGLFIAQLMCLHNMISLGDVGNINHEHLEYYSLQSLCCLFEQAGLEIIDIEENTVNGSSYRLFAQHKGARVKHRPGAFARMQRAAAREDEFHNPAFYHKFYTRMEQAKTRVVNFLQNVVLDNKSVWILGASTKGNTICQFYEIDKLLIEAAADRSSEKVGRVMVGSGIPIVSEEAFRAVRPDYALILPYAFVNEIIARERSWLQDGGQFIVPLPVPSRIYYDYGTINVEDLP